MHALHCNILPGVKFIKLQLREMLRLHRFINSCHQPHPSIYHVMTKFTYRQFINISDIVRGYYVHWGMSGILLLKDQILQRLILCCKSTNPYNLGTMATQWFWLDNGSIFMFCTKAQLGPGEWCECQGKIMWKTKVKYRSLNAGSALTL